MNLRSQACLPYCSLRLKGSRAVSTLEDCACAPKPRAFDQVKLFCIVNPRQSAILSGNETGVVVAVANAGVQIGPIGVRAGAAVGQLSAVQVAGIGVLCRLRGKLNAPTFRRRVHPPAGHPRRCPDHSRCSRLVDAFGSRLHRPGCSSAVGTASLQARPRTARESGAVARARERGLEERLRGYGGWSWSVLAPAQPPPASPLRPPQYCSTRLA